MNAWVREILGISLVVVLTIGSMAGCSANQGDDNQGNSGGDSAADTAMGRFLETEVGLPEEVAVLLGVCKLEDGSLRVAGRNEKQENGFWRSKDNGENWEKEAGLPQELTKSYIINLALSPTGTSAVIVMDGTGLDDMAYNTYTLDKDLKANKLEVKLPGYDMSKQEGGASASPSAAVTLDETEQESKRQGDTQPESETHESETETNSGAEGEEGSSSNGAENILNELKEIHMTDDGQLLGGDYNGNVYLINQSTGELEKTFEGNGSTTGFYTAGNTLIIVGAEKVVQLYDIGTGDPLSSDQVLTDELFKTNVESFVAGNKALLMKTGNEEDTLYYCNDQGLFRHKINGTVCEQVIDGELTSLGSPGTGLIDMTVVSDQEFLVAASTNSGKNYQLLRFTYSKDTPTRPSKELTLYTLQDNMEVHQAISMFQKENPEYYIAMQVGITGEDGVTASDALRSLNTDIMAGKGPDIILLDGMPVESYLEKGILADITDIIDAIQGQDGFFGNIVNAYLKDKSYYAVPTRFSIPMIESSQEVLAAASDMTALADKAEELREKDKEVKDIITIGDIQSLTERLYQSYSPAIVKEDGTLDEQKVQEFFTQTKRIYDTAQKEEEGTEYVVSMNYNSAYTDLGGGIMSLLGKSALVNIGDLASINSFMNVTSADEEMGNTDYGLLSLAGKKVFVPKGSIGINSKSSKIEDAKKFVSYLFGKEAQGISQGSGFPVNKAAYAELCTNKTGKEEVGGFVSSDNLTGVTIDLMIRWPKEEQFNKLNDLIQSLDTPMVTDSVIRDTVMEQMAECIQGNVTPEQATSSVMQKINLYLSE